MNYSPSLYNEGDFNIQLELDNIQLKLDSHNPELSNDVNIMKLDDNNLPQITGGILLSKNGVKTSTYRYRQWELLMLISPFFSFIIVNSLLPYQYSKDTTNEKIINVFVSLGVIILIIVLINIYYQFRLKGIWFRPGDIFIVKDDKYNIIYNDSNNEYQFDNFSQHLYYTSYDHFYETMVSYYFTCQDKKDSFYIFIISVIINGRTN